MQDVTNSSLSKEKMIGMLRSMYLIRSFELKMQEIFKAKGRAGDFVGALHSYEGQEAVAVGVCASVKKDDYVFSTHRGHGHALAKGADLKKVVAELLGKVDGYSGGRGGSMHLFDAEIGLMGGNGIVGGGLPLVLGVGYSVQYRQTDQVAVAFFGEAATSQGSFHESLNMAAIWKFPIIYVCENNLYAATTHVSKNCPLEDIAGRAAGYGIPGEVVDGNDVLAVYHAASEAVSRARAGKGPTLIECKTYRYQPHCMVIREHRASEEIESWKARDPLKGFEARLLADKVARQDQLDDIQAEVDRSLEQAIKFGKNSPLPDPQTVADGFWAD